MRSRREFLWLCALGSSSFTSAFWWEIIRNKAIATSFKYLSKRTNRHKINPTQPSTFPAKTLSIKTSSFTTVQVNEAGEVIKHIPGEVHYVEETLDNGSILEMAMIPGGIFRMGSLNLDGDSDDDEYPQHKVTVAPYAIGRYPVTQAQWTALMENNPSSVEGDRRPVDTVTWHDAIEFCHKLSDITGHEYRLPSEAEWEYACRAGTNTPFNLGPMITGALANCHGHPCYTSALSKDRHWQTTEIGTFPANRFGLYDMHGNVWEWCLDHWHENYANAPRDSSAWLSDNNSQYRILRGGSWILNPNFCRSASRFRLQSNRQYNHVGFRLAMSLPHESKRPI